MEFLVKVITPTGISKKEVIADLKHGLHYICGSGDPKCPYLKKLRQVRIEKED